jgi:hypothetical protein
MMAAGAPRPLPPSLRDRYLVQRALAVSSRSTVYLAHDPTLGRDVVVKLVTTPPGQVVSAAGQQAEGRRTASLNHHAVTTLYDAGVDTSGPGAPQVFLVMEYIPGSDLRERLMAGPLTPTQVCWLGLDLAEGLEAVHEAGFIHHDIKPANVLLADRGADTRIRAKLADFGISTLIGVPDLSEFTTGTAAYLSPEQVEGEDATPASDVYALGLVLLEALTGRVQYPGDARRSAFARIERQPEMPAGLPEGMARILERMTAREPADRPTPKEVARAFGSIVLETADRGTERGPVAPETELRAAEARRRYAIRDTPADDAFDTVTRLAAQMLDVPVAVVTIVDRDRVWLKSGRGLDATEIDRNMAFCVTTDPGTGRPWAITDVREDDRLRDHPMVAGEGKLRSYAAAPLMTHDGVLLGALCVFDHEPREFLQRELDNLADLASVIVRELELRLSSRRALFDRD